MPRLQEAEKNQLAIEQAKRTLAKPDTYAVGGTHVERPYTPGGPPAPYTVPAGLPPIEEKALTETQAKGQEFVLRVRRDLDRVDTQFNKGKILTSGSEATKNVLPGGNYLVSEEYRTARDGLQNWGAAFLTHVSGAAVSPTEAGRNLPAFIPQPGDSDKQIEEKATRRRDFTNAIEKATTPGQVKAIEREKDRLNDDYNFDVQAKQPVVRVQSIDEARALPPGQKIILPDGDTGQVPRRKRTP